MINLEGFVDERDPRPLNRKRGAGELESDVPVTESTPNRPKPLSVGVIVGGFTPESKIWREALMRLSRDVSGIRDQCNSDVNINVEFQIPGHIISPDFQGVRTGAFRKADRRLKIQVALPVDPPDDPYAYGVQTMREAVDAAEAWSGRRRIEFDPAPLRSLIALLDKNPPR